MDEQDSVLAVVDGIETPINNLDELKTSISFLLRTDTQQEWTNGRTKDNWISFPMFDEESLIFGDDENRRGLAEILSDSVTVLLAGENTELTDDRVKNFLYTFTIVKIDDKGNISNEPFSIEERDFIIGQFIMSPYADLVALVCHRDYEDGCERMHGMFLWEPGELNRIMSVMRLGEDEDENDSKINNIINQEESDKDTETNEKEDGSIEDGNS